jgi:ankyrin repeat protein
MDKLDAVIAAARQGDVSRVSALLDEDPALATAATMLGSQPIHAAYLGGHQPVVELLLSRGVSLDTGLAAELGMLERVEPAVRADPDLAKTFSSTGSTLLHRACYWGQVAVSRLLLANGADANAATRDSFLQIRPLGCAVATADVPNPSDHQETVLELVRLLLGHGADVNGRRRDGLTALHSAAYRGQLRVMRYLLEHGADAGTRGYEGAGPHAGQTAADLALAQGQHEAVLLLASAA